MRIGRTHKTQPGHALGGEVVGKTALALQQGIVFDPANGVSAAKAGRDGGAAHAGLLRG